MDWAEPCDSRESGTTIHVPCALLDTSSSEVVPSSRRGLFLNSYRFLRRTCGADCPSKSTVKRRHMMWTRGAKGGKGGAFVPPPFRARGLSISGPFKLNITSEQPRIPEKGIFLIIALEISMCDPTTVYIEHNFLLIYKIVIWSNGCGLRVTEKGWSGYYSLIFLDHALLPNLLPTPEFFGFRIWSQSSILDSKNSENTVIM